MKYVIVDLEMNPVSNEYPNERKVSRLETIQIGAVLLDEKYQEIGSFVTLVKPEYNTRIQKRYEKLTGIKTSMVESAPHFKEALGMFFNWCGSIQDEVQIIQWSENDYLQFTRELQMKGISVSEQNQKYMKHVWLDFQAEYEKVLGLERNISLKDAIMYAGEDFHGHQHDALVDARNTACLFEIVRDEEKCEKALKHVIEVLKPKTEVSLGDMFDFSGLSLSA